MNEIIIAHMTAMKDAINGNNNNNRNIPEIDDFFLHCYYLFMSHSKDIVSCSILYSLYKCEGMKQSFVLPLKWFAQFCFMQGKLFYQFAKSVNLA